MLSTVLILALTTLYGCAAPPSALFLLPVTGTSNTFQVHEYAIAEQSKDNPNHLEFQQRVQAEVTAQQAGWHFPSPQDAIKGPNEILNAFGYALETNPSPPFSGYALYHENHLIQRDIANFWPVSISNGMEERNFLFSFETMNGEKLVANADGIHPWPNNTGNTTRQPESRTPPVYLGNQVAYAESAGGEVSVYAGSGLLYSANAGMGKQAQSLQSWTDASGSQHWGLEVDRHLVIDGIDLNQTHGYDAIFNWQLIDGQPFYFYQKNGAVHLNYAGQDLPYNYDQIVHENTGELTIYNPGSTDHIIWFYALRDGLWYYVEAGLFN